MALVIVRLMSLVADIKQRINLKLYKIKGEKMTEKITSTIIGAASGAGVCAAGQAIVAGVGFTSQGVLAGSIAAGVQSGIGNVVAGSAFAGLQAIGATGAIISVAPVAVVAGGVVGLIYAFS